MFSARQGFYYSQGAAITAGVVIAVSNTGITDGGILSQIEVDPSGNMYTISSATNRVLFKFSASDGGILWQTEPSNVNLFGANNIHYYNGDLIAGDGVATATVNSSTGVVTNPRKPNVSISGGSEFTVISGTRYFTANGLVFPITTSSTVTQRTLSAFGTTNRVTDNIIYNSNIPQLIITGRCIDTSGNYAPFLLVTPTTFSGTTIKYMLFGAPASVKRTISGVTVGFNNAINMVGWDATTLRSFYISCNSTGTSISAQTSVSGVRLYGCVSDGYNTYIYGGSYPTASSLYVACISPTGARTWERTISCADFPTRFSPGAESKIVVQDGYLYFLGNGIDPVTSQNSKGYIIKMKADGSTLGTFTGDAGTFTFGSTTLSYSSPSYTFTSGSPTFSSLSTAISNISMSWGAAGFSSVITPL